VQALLDHLAAARDVSTPLLVITTPDQPAIAAAIAEHLNGSTPIVTWDRSRGFAGRNDKGREAIGVVCRQEKISPDQMPMASADPANAFRMAIQFPKGTILIAFSLNRFLHEANAGEAVQAILNLRDAYKSDQRTFIGLSPDFELPSELRHDTIVMDDPLPDEDHYSLIVRDIYEQADLPKPPGEFVSKAALSVRGLSAFEAEQSLAMALALSPKGDGIDLTEAWALKRAAVAKIKGLTMTLTGPDVRDLRGLDQIIKRLSSLWQGPQPPLLVVRVDEIDKSFGGLSGAGDNTGVTQYQHQQFLTQLEDNGWIGAILVGIRGSGKTILTQSIGVAHGAPTIAMDTGAMKASKLGASEEYIRDSFRTIHSIGGRRVLVLATCNKLDVLPAELLRRFKLGIYYFDLMTPEERASLWPVYLKKYGHPLDSPRPDDTDWTGAEIRNCCEIAYLEKSTIAEVGRDSIVPVTRSDPRGVEALRAQADACGFLSVSYPGTYRRPGLAVAAPMQGRRINRKES